LASLLLSHLKQKIDGLTLVPSGGGCFELTLDGELVYSKLATGAFPDERKMLALATARSKQKV
jgi:selenoprotein W-related protein